MTRLSGANFPAWGGTVYHSELCPVDISPMLAWLKSSDKPWHQTASETKPTRVFKESIPAELLQPIYDAVFPCFACAVEADSPMLSRMLPGQSHPYHVDRQKPHWITRVHVPLTTNPGCWMMFEPEGVKVYFEPGTAYSFNAVERHAFGNDGESERVHLIFDVLRKD